MESVHSQNPVQVPAKPKLVFFSYKYDEWLPDFLLIHHREHIQCLSEAFDVTIIDDACDYQHICDKYQPDLTLFESGLNILTCRRPAIANLQACRQIPRLGFINADAWCETREGTLSDMDQWRLDALFSISVTAVEHAPEIADRLFVLPNFVDPQLYRDYGESKIIPILLTGAKGPQYPWRRRVYRLVAEHYPSMSCPHGGYLARSDTGQVMYGERYARTINASCMAPTCGTIAREVVRKHFEIPACKACLITEKSAGLEAAGFVDMQNCVFADEKDVLDKVAYLFKNPEQLQSITDAGHQLVHSRHTVKHRDQILQWLNLSRRVGASQRIVQPNPFEPLSIVESTPGTITPYIISHGLHLELIRQGDDKLTAGKYQEGEALYLRCLNYMNRLPEAKLRLALCSLYIGKAQKAVSWVFEPIQYSLDEYKASAPDPVEWAYYIISLLCLGKLADASQRAREFPELCHPELERARWIVDLLSGKGRAFPRSQRSEIDYRPSIHRLPRTNADEWLDQLSAMFKACRQTRWSELLTKYRGLGPVTGHRRSNKRHPEKHDVDEGEGTYAERSKGRLPSTLPQKGASASFKNRLLLYKVRRKLQSIASTALRKSEAKWGYFLPHAASKERNDSVFRAIRELARDEDITTALIAGARIGEVGTEALLAGARENSNALSVVCISRSERLPSIRKGASATPRVKWYGLPMSWDPANPDERLDDFLREMKQDQGIAHFDVVLIDSTELGDQAAASGSLGEEVRAAKVVILNDINGTIGHEKYCGLLESPDHTLVNHNPGLRNGYAIFRKMEESSGARENIDVCALSS
jgi:hypothetical protein